MNHVSVTWVLGFPLGFAKNAWGKPISFPAAGQVVGFCVSKQRDSLFAAGWLCVSCFTETDPYILVRQVWSVYVNQKFNILNFHISTVLESSRSPQIWIPPFCFPHYRIVLFGTRDITARFQDNPLSVGGVCSSELVTRCSYEWWSWCDEVGMHPTVTDRKEIRKYNHSERLWNALAKNTKSCRSDRVFTAEHTTVGMLWFCAFCPMVDENEPLSIMINGRLYSHQSPFINH